MAKILLVKKTRLLFAFLILLLRPSENVTAAKYLSTFETFLPFSNSSNIYRFNSTITAICFLFGVIRRVNVVILTNVKGIISVLYYSDKGDVLIEQQSLCTMKNRISRTIA